MMVCRDSGSRPDGTPNQSTKPASGQVAGKPQPSVAAARVRCSPPPQPSPLKGEGVSRVAVGAPPSGRFAVRSGGVAGSSVGSLPGGTPNESTKPASGQVAGYPQASHPQGVRRWVPSCFAATLPQPLKGEGAQRAFVGAGPSRRLRSWVVVRTVIAPGAGLLQECIIESRDRVNEHAIRTPHRPRPLWQWLLLWEPRPRGD